MTVEVELAWAAGFFDGEGCTRLARCGGTRGVPGRWLYPDLSITQHHREVLDRFQTAVGAGKVYGPYSGRIFQWKMVGDGVPAILEKLWPNLGTEKRAQASEVLLAYCEKQGPR